MKSLTYRLQDALYQYAGWDRRVQFDNLPTSESDKHTADIIQFYSSYDNIGNYLPVLGIRQMLDRRPDVCCAHRSDIDFEYVNKEYKCAIIGGAGLLHKSFSQFWTQIKKECNIPIVVWGVGVCLPDDNPEVAKKEAVSDVFEKAELVNVRDSLTASIYKADAISVSVCPTVVFLDQFKDQADTNENILVSWHKGLMTEKENEEVIDYVKSYSNNSVIFTDNVQRPSEGLIDILERYYLNSKIVVTSRLHGAIIAYGLDIPYISIAKDEKLRSFVDDYGNGKIVEHVDDLRNYSLFNSCQYLCSSIEIDGALEFGRKASKIVNDICE